MSIWNKLFGKSHSDDPNKLVWVNSAITTIGNYLEIMDAIMHDYNTSQKKLDEIYSPLEREKREINSGHPEVVKIKKKVHSEFPSMNQLRAGAPLSNNPEDLPVLKAYELAANGQLEILQCLKRLLPGDTQIEQFDYLVGQKMKRVSERLELEKEGEERYFDTATLSNIDEVIKNFRWKDKDIDITPSLNKEEIIEKLINYWNSEDPQQIIIQKELVQLGEPCMKIMKDITLDKSVDITARVGAVHCGAGFGKEYHVFLAENLVNGKDLSALHAAVDAAIDNGDFRAEDEAENELTMFRQAADCLQNCGYKINTTPRS